MLNKLDIRTAVSSWWCFKFFMFSYCREVYGFLQCFDQCHVACQTFLRTALQTLWDFSSSPGFSLLRADCPTYSVTPVIIAQYSVRSPLFRTLSPRSGCWSIKSTKSRISSLLALQIFSLMITCTPGFVAIRSYRSDTLSWISLFELLIHPKLFSRAA